MAEGPDIEAPSLPRSGEEGTDREGPSHSGYSGRGLGEGWGEGARRLLLVPQLFRRRARFAPGCPTAAGTSSTGPSISSSGRMAKRSGGESPELAWERFQTILVELVGELALLRAPVEAAQGEARGSVARRMLAACSAYRPQFITPMAAVAGAVADELIASNPSESLASRAPMSTTAAISRCTLAVSRATASVCSPISGDSRGAQRSISMEILVTAGMPVRGVATSGWRGRSFSLGIADSVTVLAALRAQADAAATMIANAVDVDDATVIRQSGERAEGRHRSRRPARHGGSWCLAPARVTCALQAGAGYAMGRCSAMSFAGRCSGCRGRCV